MELFRKDWTNKDFDLISDIILNKIILVANDTKYRICEIEMYLQNEDHKDLYVHCNPEQKNYGTFYFHKYQNGTYKSGTWKGLDIVFGNKNKYFGILIRSIMNLDTEEFIEGPCRCVNTILQEFGFKTVADFFVNNKPQITLDDSDLHLKSCVMEHKDIYSGTRIGLSNKYPEYKDRMYRYVIYQNKIKKGKKSLIKNNF